MSSIAQVIDGQIQSTATISQESEVKTSNSSLDKDAFLQLLVAQMKYQDPLQPTSNTEYVSQLATFSQLEEMQNMTGSMELMRASGLVGEYVFVTTTTSSGNQTTIEGYVDSIVYEAGKAYMEIDGELYSVDDLDTVVDKAYLNAFDKVTQWVSKLEELPDVDEMTADEAQKVAELQAEFEAMSSYEQAFVGSDVQTIYEQYVDKMEELLGE
ncbi:MAG: hypothetical protein IJ485_01680 [Lachnospiraceae bacterium]|nr:hypothetical protein [Lachnospiraceae bacterium]